MARLDYEVITRVEDLMGCRDVRFGFRLRFGFNTATHLWEFRLEVSKSKSKLRFFV